MLVCIHLSNKRVRAAHVSDSSGWLRVSVRFDVEEMACEYALGFGSKLEVVEPRTLREKVIAAAQEVVRFYQPQTNTDNTD